MPLIYVSNTDTGKSELLNTDLIARVSPRTVGGGSAVHLANGTVMLVSESIHEIQIKDKLK